MGKSAAGAGNLSSNMGGGNLSSNLGGMNLNFNQKGNFNKLNDDPFAELIEGGGSG
jgi:hypothetical protein